MGLLDARRETGVKIETMVAGLAAVATGAAVFLMPAGILQEAVLASGANSMLPPLDPPLGMKARLGLTLLAAGFALGLVLLLMRVFVRSPARPTHAADQEAAVPRIRRRDRHPDAPARAPFSVTRDAGVASDEIAPPWPEQTGEQQVLRRIKGRSPEAAEEAVAEPARAAEVADPIEPCQPASTLDLTDCLEPEAEPELVAGPERPAETVEPREPAPVTPDAAKRPAWFDDSVPQPAAVQEEDSLSDLLARFERAIERKMAAPQAAAGAPSAPPPVEEGDGTEFRLRSALENLKRFAPRG